MREVTRRAGQGHEWGGNLPNTLLENVTVVSNAFYANLRNTWSKLPGFRSFIVSDMTAML